MCVFTKTAGPSASYSIGVRCGKLYKLLFQVGMDVEVMLGDDTVVRDVGRGTLYFRESP